MRNENGALRQRNVLVVEDEYMIAALVIDFLEELGAHVVGRASSVHEAVEILEHHRVDAAILDTTWATSTFMP